MSFSPFMVNVVLPCSNHATVDHAEKLPADIAGKAVALVHDNEHARIGESAFTAANSMISMDAPPFSRVAGDRARFVGLNTIGLDRRGFAPEVVATLRHAFHVIFQSKLRFEIAVTRVERECGESPEVMRLLDFLRRSERGFIH